MSLIVASPSNFITAGENVVLQNNLVKITFPKAIDKNNYDISLSAITYQIRYIAQPIYCAGTTSTSYIYTETTDVSVTTAWSNITNIVESDGIVTTRITTPSFSSDMVVKYEVRALDDYNIALSPTLTGSNMYLIKNLYATIETNLLDWSGVNNNISIAGKVIDPGFSYPANYSEITSTQWTRWRSGLISIFGDLDFTFHYKYGIVSTTLGETVEFGNGSFKLSTKNLITNPEYSLTIENEIINDIPKFNPDRTYYFKIYLQKSGILSSSNSTLDTRFNPNALLRILLNQIPVWQIKKGVVKANLPKSNIAKTGGGMFSHGTQQRIGTDPNQGHSVTLYDHHVKANETLAANEPSIGFMDTQDNQMAQIRYIDDDLYAYDKAGNRAAITKSIPFYYLNASNIEFHDLNEYRKYGDYVLYGIQADLALNFPKDYGTISAATCPYLEIRKFYGDTNIVQRLFKRTSNNMWIRHRKGSSPLWSQWELMNTNAKKSDTIVIGNATQGHTLSDCDLLWESSMDFQWTLNEACQMVKSPGGSIKILEGNYYFNSSLTINKGDINIRGVGLGTRIRSVNRDQLFTIMFNNSQGRICIEDMTIYDMIIHCDGLSEVQMSNIKMIEGTPARASAYNFAFIVNVGTFIMDNCTFSSPFSGTNDKAIRHLCLLRCGRAFVNNSFFYAGSFGVVADTTSDIKISSCTFISNYASVYCYHNSQTDFSSLIVNGSAFDSRYYGIFAGFSDHANNRISVTGNTFYCPNIFAISLASRGGTGIVTGNSGTGKIETNGPQSANNSMRPS